MKRLSLIATLGLTVLVALAVCTPAAWAYDRYNDGCQNCHGSFTGSRSTKGSIFPGNNKHTMHRSSSYMDADCNLCHASNDSRDPWIGSSDGIPSAGIAGIGCTGCHNADGLRSHHEVNGVSCDGCHSIRQGPPEDTLPEYYGTAYTRADNPCNSVASSNVNENWTTNDFIGLDNDGDGLYDGNDPDCSSTGPEADCFDGVDNDADGSADCADSDCQGATNGSCDTGQAGICSTGTSACQDLALACVPDSSPQTEGPPSDATCGDGLDNDCDAATDGNDPDCQLANETQCFDGLDNDADGAADCADADCDGATDGACDTGEAGVCAAGTNVCAGGQNVCERQQEPMSEGNASGNCDDGVDNDCDGAVDYSDDGCTMMEADVWVSDVKVPKSRKLAVGSSARSRRLAVTAGADTVSQDARISLTVEPIDAVTVAVSPASVTGTVVSGDVPTQALFSATFTCNTAGTWTVTWSATIEAAQNRDTSNDTVTRTTTVTCRSAGRGKPKSTESADSARGRFR